MDESEEVNSAVDAIAGCGTGYWFAEVTNDLCKL